MIASESTPVGAIGATFTLDERSGGVELTGSESPSRQPHPDPSEPNSRGARGSIRSVADVASAEPCEVEGAPTDPPGSSEERVTQHRHCAVRLLWQHAGGLAALMGPVSQARA
jgi:hypothetical protein